MAVKAQSRQNEGLWGDVNTWGGWARPDAEMIWRVYLPLETVTGIPVRWPTEPDGQLRSDLWWPALQQHPGNGGEGLSLFPAFGRIEPVTLAHLIRVLVHAEFMSDWRHTQHLPVDLGHDRSLLDLSRTWLRSFEGWAWSLGSALSLSAPPHADSVVVAGPRFLDERLDEAGLQRARVRRTDAHWIWND